jgi:presenilin-like A22 family membrane protease
MKHDLSITIALVIFFVLAQIVGLVLINANINEVKTEGNVTTVVHADTSLGPRPEMTGLGTFAYIAIGLIIGTLLVLLIIKMKKVNLWKAWFFLAVFLAISLALGVFLKSYYAFLIALALAFIKILKPNMVIHNITEVLMYAGIAVFLVPMLNVLWAAILLLAISAYDVYAVFKSKHMVKMAKFQAKSKVFAGLFIPYTPKEQETSKASATAASNKLDLPKSINFEVKKEKVEKRNAVLGGGDIAFPLLFTGAVMESLVVKGLARVVALQQSLIVTITTTIALALLFIFAKKDKFYPAMPIVSAGCFIGYVIVLLL